MLPEGIKAAHDSVLKMGSTWEGARDAGGAVTNFFGVKFASMYPQIALVARVSADSTVLAHLLLLLLLVLGGRIEVTAQGADCLVVMHWPNGDVIAVLIPASLEVASVHFLLMDAALATLPEFLLAAIDATYEGLLARVGVLVLC